MAFFLSYLDYKAQNAQVSNALGNGNIVHTLNIFSKIPTVRSWKIHTHTHIYIYIYIYIV